MKRSTLPSRFFTAEERETIRRAIAQAESATSGEIRVHLDRRCKGDPLLAARDWFDRLGMGATQQSTGVLLYIALADHKLAVYGDEAIHRALPEGSWERLRDELRDELQKERFVEGIVAAVSSIGEALKSHFPRSPRDANELPDEISTSDG